MSTNRFRARTTLAALALFSLATMAGATESRVIGADEGDTGRLPNGFSAVHKVGALSTGSAQAFVAVGTIPPGMSTGQHLHEVDEEILYVLEGELTVVAGEQTLSAGPGETIFVPAGTWMDLSNRSDAPARALLVIPRADAERCFRLIHGIGVAEMSESDRQEAFGHCKMQMQPSPADSAD